MVTQVKLNSKYLWLLLRLIGVITLIAAMALIVVTISGKVIWADFGRAVKQSKTPVATPSILVRLTRKGFEPSEVSIPQGPFFLVFENRSGIDNLDLQFDRASSGRLKDVRVAKDAPEWVELLNLSPGDYQLSDRNHSELIFRLKVIAR